MIKVKEDNKKTIEIQQSIKSNTKRFTIIELSYPKTLDFKKSLSASEYFHKHISFQKSFFKGKNPSLNILYTKYLEELTDNSDKITKSLSLFSFHYNQRIKDYKYSFSKIEDNELTNAISSALIDVQKTLNSFRELTFKDKTVQDFFSKVDSVLSFESEQFLLSMVHLLQKVKSSSELRKFILTQAEQEESYRIFKKYNSDDGNLKLIKENTEHFVRALNRIDMRKKISELPLKITEKSKSSGKREKYISLAFSTGIIMFLISFILMQVRLLGFDSTIQFVIGLAFLYVIRDLFREEFKETIYNKIISLSPISKSKIFIPEMTDFVGISKIWFYKIDNSKSKKIEQKYKENYSIKINESIKLGNFDCFGFKKIKTATQIDLTSIMREIKRDSKEIFIYPTENDSNDVVKKIFIPRQFKLDLIIKESSIQRHNIMKPFKSDIIVKEKRITIIINRDRILKIEEKK